MMWDYAHLKPRYRRGEWATVPAPWWKRALARISRAWIGDDPAPRYSKLDRRDGLGR